MLKIISHRSTFFLDRMFNVEKDIFSLIDIAKELQLYPYLSPGKNDKQKLILNLSRQGDAFRIIAVDNRLDILQNITNTQEELPSENDFIDISKKVINEIISTLECNCNRFAFAPEYLMEGGEAEFDVIYNRVCKDEEIPVEWALLRTTHEEGNHLFFNVTEKFQKGIYKFHFENEQSIRLIVGYDINTFPNHIASNEDINSFFDSTIQILNNAKKRLEV